MRRLVGIIALLLSPLVLSGVGLAFADNLHPSPPAAAITTLSYLTNTADLPADADVKLQTVVNYLADHPKEAVALVAYASGPDNNPIVARRLSLQRALGVRDFLVTHGIAAVRVQVRAMGQERQGRDSEHLDIQAVSAAAAAVITAPLPVTPPKP